MAKSSDSSDSDHSHNNIVKADSASDEAPRSRWSLSAERKLVWKLDASLLVFSVLGLICRYIDQTNLNTAFVSGMKEDLNMYGLQLNYANTCWVVGYVVGQIPGNILLTRFSPHYVVFGLEFGWSLMTLCTTWVTSPNQLFVIRFFVGLFESAYYPGLHFLIGSWYSKAELGKRASIFQAACAIGSLLSQVLQGGVHTTLNGVAGRPGWRWIFIIDAVISFPIAIGAFFMLPDLPNIIKPNWIFSQDDIDLANARLAAEGRKGTAKGAYSKKNLLSIFSTWHIYIFTIAYSLYIFMHNVVNSMPFWFKMSPSPKYTVEQINYYPTGIYAVQMFSSFLFGWMDDKLLGQRRWPLIIFTNLTHLVVCALLAATPVYSENRAGRWALYYLTGMIEVGAGLIYAWAATIISDSSEKRGIVTATYNAVAFSFNAWLPLIFFKQTEQPTVFKGNIAVSTASGLLCIFTMLILYLSNRDEKRKQLAVHEGHESGSEQTVEVEEVEKKELRV